MQKPSQWINCSSGEFINIVNEMYGYFQNGIGSSNTSTHVNCTALKLFEKVSNKCNGKKSCEVKAESDLAGDPCGGVEKYLDIKYECLSGRCEFIYETFPASKYPCQSTR